MRIHTEFSPLKRSAAWIAHVLNDEDINDGAFSRVGIGNHHEALKATTCTATNKLFEELLARKNRGQSIPEGLPAVFKKHGDVVRDEAGIVYTVWSVERLFAEVDIREMRRARVTSRHLYQGLKPGYVGRTSKYSAADVAALKQALKQERASVPSPDTWQASADIALAMSLRTSGELQQTFRFLLEFAEKHQAGLDLLTQGNILLNMFGEPCLSDPVCRDETGEQAPALPGGLCIACLVPTQVWGINELVLEPASTLPLDQDDLDAMEAALKQFGLQPTRLQWGSDRQKAFLAQPPVRQPLWSIPDVVRHLRSDSYQQLFTN